MKQLNFWSILMLVAMLLSSNAISAQYYEPFIKKYLTNKPVKIDEDGYAYYSGNAPAYIVRKVNDFYTEEAFFAGELDNEDHELLSGDLVTINNDFRVTERIGVFADESTFVDTGFTFIYNLYGDDVDGILFIRNEAKNKYYHCRFNTREELGRLMKKAKEVMSSVEDYPLLPYPIIPKYYTYSKFQQSKKNNYNSSYNNIKGTIGAAVAVGAAIALIKNLFDDNTSSTSKSSTPSEPRDVYSMSNVEIVSDVITFGPLVFPHAQLTLRNKNNYDVDVSVELYQGKWSEGRIVYDESHMSDRVPGVSDNNSRTIRVKANTMRTVFLRADHTGRPTHFRISSVR